MAELRPERNCTVYNQIQLLADIEKWSDLKSVIQIISEREINEKKTKETRLYISNLNDEAEAFNKYIRMHWGVENSLHWTLDMTFREDEQRKRDKNSAQNFAIVRKIVLNLLKQEDSEKLSLRFLASHLRLSYGDQSARNDRFLLDHMGSGGGSPLASLHHYPPRTK